MEAQYRQNMTQSLTDLKLQKGKFDSGGATATSRNEGPQAFGRLRKADGIEPIGTWIGFALDGLQLWVLPVSLSFHLRRRMSLSRRSLGVL